MTLDMKLTHGIFIVLATVAIAMLDRLIIATNGPLLLTIAEFALSIGAIAALFSRSGKLAVSAFATAAAVVAANQILLAKGFLTFLNGAQLMSAATLGSMIADALVAIAVAALTAGAFFFRRRWIYAAVIAVLAVGTWPTSLAGVSV